jgi:hypothetical protein
MEPQGSDPWQLFLLIIGQIEAGLRPGFRQHA